MSIAQRISAAMSQFVNEHGKVPKKLYLGARECLELDDFCNKLTLGFMGMQVVMVEKGQFLGLGDAYGEDGNLLEG